ncbi:putative histone deacetylase [Corynespora cassiicola Philippines]|uniref:Histone deacetylase n=1 Tax=Corynespora cassiicola Philippines TaxID=1448308 RepID=A0A2T2NSS3_CORCC|nr:putative histone deacetylase [Corynespora cassiicola Philippines]
MVFVGNMDEDVDYVMGEETIMQSTETNGGHDLSTVDPSKITLHSSLDGNFSPRKDQLPIHSNGGPLMKPLDLEPHPYTGQDDSLDMATDEMDIMPASSPLLQIRVPPPPRFPPLPYSSSKTGLVYDARMRFHAEPAEVMMNLNEIHPEDPRRIHEIFQEIQRAGLVQGPDDSDEEGTDEQCWRIYARNATEGEICLVHSPEHYAFIQSLQEKSVMELKDLSEELDSIYFNNATFECATLAAGGAIEACRAVVRGDVRNAIAVIRPPGHHAESNAPSGFCIFNNVPIATKVCQHDFPETCRKVLILDWDVHHGNGIQHAFYEDPNVLYISLHVFKNGNFYPNLPDGNYDYTGEGPGVGRNVNIPWEEHGMGDAEYIYAFQEVVIPIANEFDPDLVIISAGFDAAEGDILGGCHVTPACYAHMTHMLMRLAKGKIAVCLEGGYNLRSIARSALAVTKTLMLQPPDRLAEDIGPPKASAVRTINQVKREQSKYWRDLFPKHLDKSDPLFGTSIRLHDVIREWQSNVLAKEQFMYPLAIRKNGITSTFEHNVIATPNITERHPLLVIFHDPPSLINIPHPVTGSVEPFNSLLADPTKRYIEWAVKNDFQVIDANIPKVVSIEEDDGEYVPADDDESRASQTRDLANYIWENYIEPYDATQVFLMGVGTAYLGLVDLLSTNENCTDPNSPVECLIGFVGDNALHTIKRATDDNIGNWYYAHSLIFVEKDHAVWDPSRQRKLRKKWGKLVKSNKDNLNSMLVEHEQEVQELLLKMRSSFEEEAPSGTNTPRGESLKSPKLPPMGFFSVSNNGPRSPRAANMSR